MNRKAFLSGLALASFAALSRGSHHSGNSGSKEVFPKMNAPELKNSYWYIGHLISILISGEDTNGTFSLIHGYEIKGLEPPPHIHNNEDESFYLLNGEINYTVGKDLLKARKGDWVFLPKKILHSFQVQTDEAEVLIHLSPGGFEDYFREMSEPARGLYIPPRPQGPPDVKRIVETASKYGIEFPGLG